MTQLIDGRNLPCPQPVILTRKALAEHPEVTILVNNTIAVENLRKLGRSLGATVREERFAKYYQLTLRHHAGSQPTPQDTLDTPTGSVYLITSELFGSGDDRLGNVLMKSFIYTLAEDPHTPKCILLVNGGVKLAFDPDIQESLRQLQAKGTRVLACGTCLDFFELTDALVVGEITNMYVIVEMLHSEAVIRI